jgi:hypothetical protein
MIVLFIALPLIRTGTHQKSQFGNEAQHLFSLLMMVFQTGTVNGLKVLLALIYSTEYKEVTRTIDHFRGTCPAL